MNLIKLTKNYGPDFPKVTKLIYIFEFLDLVKIYFPYFLNKIRYEILDDILF